MEVKNCSVCKKALLIDLFGKDKRASDGLKSCCRVCENIKHKKYAEKNIEKEKARHLKYSREHAEERSIYKKQYCKIHAEEIKESNKKYNTEHEAEQREQRRKNYIKNPEKIINRTKRYREKNLDKYCVYSQNRRALKLLLPHTLTTQQWDNIKQAFDNKCAYCGKQLPLTQEHFIPLSKGGEYTNNNVIPSCQSCNSSKGNKLFEKWYSEYEKYSKQRENKILKFLNYKGDAQQLKIM